MRPQFARAIPPASRQRMCVRANCGLSYARPKRGRKRREGCWHREQSPVRAALHGFQQLRHVVITESERQAQFAWGYNKRFAVLRFGRQQSEANEMVD